MPEKERPAAARERDEKPAAEGLTVGGPADVPPIEPGSPSLENAAFVLLGVLVALAVVIRLAQLLA